MSAFTICLQDLKVQKCCLLHTVTVLSFVIMVLIQVHAPTVYMQVNFNAETMKHSYLIINSLLI